MRKIYEKIKENKPKNSALTRQKGKEKIMSGEYFSFENVLIEMRRKNCIHTHPLKQGLPPPAYVLPFSSTFVSIVLTHGIKNKMIIQNYFVYFLIRITIFMIITAGTVTLN